MHHFPEGFKIGTATAAFQIEGGWDQGGKGWSIWDAFCETQFQKIQDGSNGKVACNHFRLFESDIKLMASLGIKNYRFSISWPRIQPSGTGPPNQAGIDFYNKLIDCLIDSGIEPAVTLYHWDLPLALQIEHGGWLSKDMAHFFRDYAAICYSAFGDRVKKWITLNEPWCMTVLGYGNGEHAPGIKSDDGSKVYLAAHHSLLAHAAAVEEYRSKDRAGGEIGIALNCVWAFPEEDPDPEAFARNVEASERCLLFSLGWYADPIWKGDYPDAMKRACGERLPSFTSEEKKLLKGSSDFLGLNYYLSDMVRDVPNTDVGYFADQNLHCSGSSEWKRTDMGWNVVPRGLRQLLVWAHRRYKPHAGLYVTENGCAVHEPDEEKAVKDSFRVSYLQEHLAEVSHAISLDGADVRGYYAWSFCDNFEWSFGYAKRFGIIRVDYGTQERIIKDSARFLSRVSKTLSVEEPSARFF